jgi:hypothetical protein
VQDEPTSREDRWFHLADMVGAVMHLFGSPAAIAAMRILRRALRRDILHWLAPLEALARRLLLIEATKLPRRNAPPSRAVFTGRLANALRDSPPPSEDPAHWRVRFSLWPHGAHRRAPGHALQEQRAARPRSPKENALAIAKRIEALVRMLENRKAYVLRMATLLAARREQAFVAFTPYRYGGPVRFALEETQAELDEALTNTS